MAYRSNVTDKEQNDIERAESDSAIRLAWFDGRVGQSGRTKSIPSYDSENQSQNTARLSPNDATLANTRTQMTVGSHNDKPHRFSNPGKA